MDFYAEAMGSAFASGGPEAYNEVRAELGRTDLFFLLVFILRMKIAMHPWIFARCREVQRDPNDRLDLWAREHFKAVDVNEPVPTPVGFKKHGDLKIGDWVFGADGDPTQVIAKTEVFTNADCYRVTFDDDYSVVVSGDHLWTVEQKTRKRCGKGRMYRESVTLNTREMSLRDHSPDNRMSIPVAPPVFQIQHMLPIEPYTLGCWLGDGTCAENVLTCGDEEVFDNIREHYEVSKGRPSKDITKTIYGIRPILRELKLLNNKHIPRDYFVSSVEQRRSLLQGLMDTDGTCNDRGTATFVNKNKELADGVFDLAASLGLKPRFNIYEQDHGTVYYVSFQAYKVDMPFRMARKLSKCKDGVRKARRFITKIEAVESIPVSCIQVENPDGLYLIGRNHVTTHNSTVITFALTIFDIINNPEITVGIFSHTKSIARDFLKQIKTELEMNEDLWDLYPDVFYRDPAKNSPRWSVDGGIVVKRTQNPKEATVEGHGLVDGMPTGRHFKLKVYDDVVTKEGVNTPEQIHKTTEAFQMSDNLGSEGGHNRYIGTRYHLFDTYSVIIDQKIAVPRIHAATYNGKEHGIPVLLSRETLANKRLKQGPYVYSSQMLLNPVADASMGFKLEWIIKQDIEYNTAMKRLWRFIIVDPAGGKQRTGNDYTTMLVIGYGEDGKYRVLDMRRDRMRLTQRADTLIELHKKWKPQLVAYEEYGMQADIEHIQFRQKQDLYEFDIHPLGGNMNKKLRILRLVPYFEGGRIILPTYLHQTDYQDQLRDLVKDFIEEEYTAFPVLKHDDMIDCLARIEDLVAEKLIQSPIITNVNPESEVNKRLAAAKNKIANGSKPAWMN